MTQNFLTTLALTVLASTTSAALAASPVKLSGVMAVGGDVVASGHAVAPGAIKRAIFIADREANNVLELWSTPVTGGTPVKLSGTIAAADSGVVSLKVSPDGNWVAFVTAAGLGSSEQLWLVANDGTAATPAAVSGVMPGTGTILDYQWSPNSLRLVFRAARDVFGQVELFSKPLSGAVADLSTLPDTNRSVVSMKISGDSSRVVFVADRDADNVNELYSVPITGGAPTKLSGGTIATADVDSNFLISANATRVAFLADRDVDGVFEIYGNALDGSTGVIKLSGALLGATSVTHFRITPNGARVVYRASRDTPGVSEIYSASATAIGSSIKLSGTIISGGNTTANLDLTADGQRVVFLANKDSATLQELFSAPVDAANAAVKISDPAAPGVGVFSFALCPNSVCVVYSTIPAGLEPKRVVSTSSTAPVPIHVSAPIGVVAAGFPVSSTATTFRAFNLDITPDSRRVLWIDGRNRPSGFDLLSAVIGSGTPVAISGSVVEGGSVQSGLVVSADSTTIVFAADKDTDNVTELYAVAVDAGGSVLDIDGDGAVLPTTDGLMLTRWQLGIRGTALFGGITFSGTATRTTAIAIEDHLRRLTETGLVW